MNYFIFIARASLEDFRRNKLRTVLTSLGILIGVASVVLLISFGLGLKRYVKNQFESLGTNLVIVLPGQVFQNGQFRQGGGFLGGARFDEKDARDLKKIDAASYVVPVFMKTVALGGSGKSELGDVFATTADIFPVRNLEVEVGNIFNKSDVDKRSKVAVIGPKIAEKLFGSAFFAISKTIKAESQTFKIIGVLKSKGGGGFGGPDFDSFIYVPYKSAYALNSSKEFVTFYLKAENKEAIQEVKDAISKTLLRRYKSDDFSVVEQTEILNAVTSIFGVFNIVLVAIAAISLIVGGIGIMNIMYVSVVEKTKEIGIRRAIGATQRDILSQFLMESVVLSLFGGLSGLALSFVIVIFIQRFFPAYINLLSVIVALGVSSAIGIIFGVFPARRASQLSPIEAIRYE